MFWWQLKDFVWSECLIRVHPGKFFKTKKPWIVNRNRTMVFKDLSSITVRSFPVWILISISGLATSLWVKMDIIEWLRRWLCAFTFNHCYFFSYYKAYFCLFTRVLWESWTWLNSSSIKIRNKAPHINQISNRVYLTVNKSLNHHRDYCVILIAKE